MREFKDFMRSRLNRVLLVLIGVTAAMGVFAACGSNAANPDSDTDGNFSVVWVDVDGKQLRCVTYDGGYDGGMSCNWDEYNGLVK